MKSKKRPYILTWSEYFCTFLLSITFALVLMIVLDCVFDIRLNEAYKSAAYLVSAAVVSSFFWDHGCLLYLAHFKKNEESSLSAKPSTSWIRRILLVTYLICLLASAIAGIYGWILVFKLESLGMPDGTKTEIIYYGQNMKIQTSHYSRDYFSIAGFIMLLQLAARMAIDVYFPREKKEKKKENPPS